MNQTIKKYEAPKFTGGGNYYVPIQFPTTWITTNDFTTTAGISGYKINTTTCTT
jgi:hypothetical protein